MTRRVAVVTRVGTGIGAAVAGRLAADGFAVAAVDGDEAAVHAVAADVGKNGGRAVAVPGDVGDPDGAAAVVGAVTRALGPPSVLVNGARPAATRPFAEMTVSDWDLTIRENLRAYFLMARAVLPSLRERGQGRIVNIAGMASMGALREADHCAAMAGVEGLTRALAVELGPDGITVNAVAPGYVAGLARPGRGRAVRGPAGPGRAGCRLARPGAPGRDRRGCGARGRLPR